MRTTTPLVWDDPWAEGARLQAGLRLDTCAWIAWLDDPATTSFCSGVVVLMPHPLSGRPTGG
jgi:hypothetical protein